METSPHPVDASHPHSLGLTAYGKGGFEGSIADIFYRPVAGGDQFWVYIEERHCNLINVAHGGFLLAMADIFCSGVTVHHLGEESTFVTVNLSHDFTGGVPRHSWLRGESRLRKAGKSLLFVECEFFVDDQSVGICRCVMKVISAKKSTDR